jgi:hypothetical protein
MNFLFYIKTNFKISILNHRCALEEEKKRKALNAKDKEEQDNKKGEQYNKKLAMKKQSEICLSLADTELNSSAESSSESEVNSSFVKNFLVFFYLLLYQWYIVTFTKFLTMYYS